MAESTKPSKDEQETTSDDEVDQTTLIGRFLNQFGSLLSGHNADEPAKNPVLKAFDLPTAAEHLKKCSNVIIMAGAGISTSAGIPDFRSPGTGLYSQLEKYNLPFPEAVFHLDYFRGNPKPFFLLSKELYPQKFTPTPTHYFLRLLNEKNKLLRIYTQNIDSLERIAGVPGEKLIEAHGTFFTSHCLECRKEYDLEFIKEIIFKDEIPYCTEEECKGIVKPDIVFFGEQLPARFNECRSEDFPKADFLIILGTSLKVAPFNLLTNFVDDDCPRLLINMEPAGTESSLFHRNASLLFGKASNRRDVFHQSTCDGGVMELAKLLGWEDDFNELLKSEGVSTESKIPDQTEENADRLAEQMAKATLESKD